MSKNNKYSGNYNNGNHNTNVQNTSNSNNVQAVGISEMVKQNVLIGGPSVTDQALASLLGKVNGTTNTAPVVESKTVTQEVSVQDCVPQTFEKQEPLVVEETIVQASENNANHSELHKQLGKMGLLNTVELLASAEDLTPAAIEQASIAIHMLVNNLTKDQATVVNRYYNDGINIMQYVTNKFNAAQMFFIGKELREGHDVSAISKTPAYTVSQMVEVQESVVRNLNTDYINAKMTPSVMGALRKAVENGIDISEIVGRAGELSAVQVSMLTELKYYGVDIASILGDSAQLSEEVLFSAVRNYYEKRDNMKYELANTGDMLVQVS